MAKVSLRVYNREIEGMIEAGQLEEAIAHCQFILKTYPMHVETYLLLGKAFLEARRYSDAADIFARVLMALPDNFVSHVGMSIIRDDEGKLDDAIWHMERAFEIQPSNPAIQGELRRLYGRRDGVEPPKIRLSRDALANMYAQGELFNQAIAEIRAVLAEDNNRPDLEVMLARAYFNAGQKVEAAGMASTLLKKYTYCMDALRILVDVLPGTTRSGDTQVYLQRLSMLDPYSLFVTGSAFGSDKVADSAITLDRLVYKPGAPHIESQPGWAASLGIQLPGTNPAEPEKQAADTSPHPPAASVPEPSAITAGPVTETPAVGSPEPGDANVPDWMRSAGWHESTGPVPTEPADLGVEQPVEPAAQADIPDWLKAMAPQEATDEGKAESVPESKNPPSTNEANLDWLTGIDQEESTIVVKDVSEPAAENPVPAPENEAAPEPLSSVAPQDSTDAIVSDTQPVPVNPPAASEKGSLPDWLKPMAPQEGAGTAQPASEPAPENPPSSAEYAPENLPPASQNEGLPDWLRPMAPLAAADAVQPASEPAPEKAPSASDKEGLTGWLKSLIHKEENEAVKATSEPAAENPSPAVENEDMPDWLKSIAPQEIKNGAQVAPEPAAEIPPASPENEASLDWLTGLGSTLEDGTEENTQPKTLAEDDSLPEWLTGAGMTGESTDSATNETIAAGNPPASELPASDTSEMKETPQEEAVVPKDAAAIEEPVTPAEAAPVEEPMAPLQVTPPQASTPPPIKMYEPASHPATEPPFQPSGEVKPLNIEDETLAWLENLAVKQGAKEEEMLTSPEDRPAEMPDSVNQAGGQQPVQPVKEPSTTKVKLPAQVQELPEVDETAIEHAQPSQAEPAPVVAPIPFSAPADENPQPPSVQDLTAQESPATLPEQPDEENLDWVTRPLKEPEATPEAPAPEPAQVEPAAPEASNIPSRNDITITSWLTKMDVEEALMKARSTQQAEQPAESSGSLPDWLKDLDKPTPPAEATATAKAESDLPDWLRQPVKPTGEEQATPSPSENAPGTELPSWMEEAVAVTQPTAPTTPGEWLPADAGLEPGQPQQTEPNIAQVPGAEPVPEPVPEPSSPSGTPIVHLARSSGTGMLSNIPTQDKDGNLLMTAQLELDNNNLNEAMKMYLALIKKGRLLEEVIHDLREALYRFPVDIIVWQTLGDAYMRTNQLQDALDAYTKAEELLR